MLPVAAMPLIEGCSCWFVIHVLIAGLCDSQALDPSRGGVWHFRIDPFGALFKV